MTKKAQLQLSLWICLAFLAGSAVCWVAYRIIGAEVDAQGILQEPFALIPMGFVLLIAGILTGIAHILIRRKQI